MGYVLVAESGFLWINFIKVKEVERMDRRKKGILAGIAAVVIAAAGVYAFFRRRRYD